MGDFLDKIRQIKIGGKYILVHRLGEGGQASIYLARDSNTGQEVALKLEYMHRGSSIQDEKSNYEGLQHVVGVPKVYWLGEEGDFRVMAMELLGPSLDDLFAFCGVFSLKTTLMIADQLIVRLQDIHDANYAHRDIKPSNCLLGTGSKGDLVYIADFGIADYWPRAERDSSDEDTWTPRRVVGSTRYASISAHFDRPQTRRDDLESLGYMLIEFVRGRLPWQGLAAASTEEKDQLVGEMKRRLSPRQLCAGLPAEFAEYMATLAALSPTEDPPYQQLRCQFQALAKRLGIEDDSVFDWTEQLFLLQKDLSNGKAGED